MSDYSCANCGIDTENEPLCLCDECNGPDTQAERLRAELAALKATLAPIPGVTDGTRDNEPYTLEDCAAIEKMRGKPYTRLRTTVEALHAEAQNDGGPQASDLHPALFTMKPVEMVALPRALARELLAALQSHFEQTEWLEVLRMTNEDDTIPEPESDADWWALAEKYDEQGLKNILGLMDGLAEALKR